MNLSFDALPVNAPMLAAAEPVSEFTGGPDFARQFAESARGTPPATAHAPKAATLRSYLPAYLLAAGTAVVAAGLLLERPGLQPKPPPPAASVAPLAEAPGPTPDDRPEPKPLAAAGPVKPPAPSRPRAGDPVENPPATPRFQRSDSPPEIDGELLDAHARLEAYDFAGAREAYEQVLRRKPQDTGSLLALAAIASFQGRDDEAMQLRRRAFEADPSDAATQAAQLDTTSADTQPALVESRLKSLLARQAAPPLEFALGNLLARQRRWPEAQQAYFRAVAGDADHPDYLFNLAVSLEHLHQPRIAAAHYRQALAASARRAAAFDRRLAERRLGELAAAEQP